jgi:hypothetical protein
MPLDRENDEFRAEAERLRALPRAEQRAFVAMLRTDAANRKVPKRDRDFARRRAAVLARILKLGKERKN